MILNAQCHSIMQKVGTDLTLYHFYLSNQLERLFVFLPRGENLIILFSPFNQPLAWFSYSLMR